MVAPKQESVDLVQDWLKTQTTSYDAEITVQGDYVTVQASVNTVERLLNAEYSTFGTANKSAVLGLNADIEQYALTPRKRGCGRSSTACHPI
jgi:hypothetical protein